MPDADDEGAVSYYFDSDPSTGARPLDTKSRSDAEAALKAIFANDLASNAIVLLKDGVEIWRWTQHERKQALLSFLASDMRRRAKCL